MFVVGDAGLGASSLLAQLNNSGNGRQAVMTVHGSPSLSPVPYGALSPYLADLSVEDVTSKVAVLRALWAHLEKVRKSPGPALLLVDDAHDLDTATAEMIAELVQAGWAKLVATCIPRPGIPQPLLRLWHDGTAERFDIAPLTMEQGHRLCEALLQGKVLNSTSREYWQEAGGNTLLLKTLVREAQRSGDLIQRNGVWLNAGSSHVRTLELTAVVKVQLMRISADGREALNLIALAEPVDRTLVGEIAGEPAVKELLDQRLVVQSVDSEPTLRLVSPVYGEVLRRIVPAARSLQLHKELVSRMEISVDKPESLLRIVSWSLDCGAEVPGRLLIRAAVLACKLFQSEAALRIAWAVRDPELQQTARAVMARSHYNLGHYDEAAALLNVNVDTGNGLVHMAVNSLLRSATRTALGHPASDIAEDARRLRQWGQEEAAAKPADSAAILKVTARRASLVELMAYSLSGDYRQMGPRLDELLEAGGWAGEPDGALTRSMALALQAERLCALGYPLQGRQLAMEAYGQAQPPDNDIFFLPEFIVVRLVACDLAAGEWAEAQQLLDGYAETSFGSAMVSFSGAAYVVMGYIAVRQGKLADALELLTTGLEALRDSDPQQMFRFCASMAFYVAAAQGLKTEADRLRSDYEAWGERGMHLVTAFARDFLAAGEEHLAGDGSGLAALHRSAEEAAEQNAVFLELNALAMALGLGDTTRLERLRELAGSAEGTWAAALAEYCAAFSSGSAELYLRAGDALCTASAFQLASDAYAAALSSLDRSRNRELAALARAGVARCNEELGHAGTEAQPDTVAPILTKRERNIVGLAATGLSDRMIADKLQISVRTVEGHLYRCYLKLGIAGRDELAAAAGLAEDPGVQAKKAPGT
ncbi:helix-turn-helix domain-containing protein [Arthrobacter oryzae]|uniref:helix-turn-helix domain-containing protein n=1 Tax=Arthrobacter oryzae TaxID=409290 RepID=UPI00273B11A4|nr:helix-turn-helix transcriptional regulator [Arthrobacter oryzae]WLQ05236.1 helix-turn-helix transcriptional regulator [Arthrobacter oryzae]